MLDIPVTFILHRTLQFWSKSLKWSPCNINSWLSRCSSARGSGSWLYLGNPTKVKANKFFLFTESSLKVENKEHLVDFVVTLYLSHFALMCYAVTKCHSQLCQICWSFIGCNQNGDGVSKNDKSCHICFRCLKKLKVALVNYKIYGTLSINVDVNLPIICLIWLTLMVLMTF